MHRRSRHTAPAPADSESQTNEDCVKRGRTSRQQDRNQSSAGESRSQGISWELVLCRSACSLQGQHPRAATAKPSPGAGWCQP